MEETILNFIEISPENNVEVKKLVIFLHGYGSNKEDMISLTKDFKDILPTAQFISINAPYECEAGVGFQWFSLQKMDFYYIRKEIRKNYDIVNNFIRQQVERFNIAYEDVILIGFSQGTMMSTYASLRNENKLGCIIGFSGMVPDDIESLSNEIKTKQNIFLVHGDQDFVVSYEYFIRSEKLLKALDVPVKSHVCSGLTHSINMEGIESAREYITKLITKKIK